MLCSVVYWSEATSEPPKVVWTPSVLNIFTSKCPSRHNGVHIFDIRTSKSGPAMVFLTFWLRNVLRATTACTFSTSEPPKVARTCGVLYILTWKCASRHNGVHFFDIATSKSGPTMVCFVHFDLEMCFAPQRRALFRHRNFQKWSDNGVFCAFWLGNVLRATTACTFSTSQLPKVVRQWCVLYILTSKCASRHNGVQLFISHLASWLRTRRFSEPTFRPSGAPNHWKNSVSRLSYLFAHLHLLSSYSFSSPLLSSNLSLLSASSLLCFSSVHLVGSLTSKLPSIKCSFKKVAHHAQGAKYWPYSSDRSRLCSGYMMFHRPHQYNGSDISAATHCQRVSRAPATAWPKPGHGERSACQALVPTLNLGNSFHRLGVYALPFFARHLQGLWSTPLLTKIQQLYGIGLSWLLWPLATLFPLQYKHTFGWCMARKLLAGLFLRLGSFVGAAAISCL